MTKKNSKDYTNFVIVFVPQYKSNIRTVSEFPFGVICE